MKKILTAIVLGSLLTGLIMPLAVFAQLDTLPDTCRLKYDLSEIDSVCTKGDDVSVDDYGTCCMFNTIYSATNWLFMILVLLSVLFIIYGGFAYVTASGDPEKATKGGKIIVYALIGLAIALFAKVIPSIIRFIMGF